ncbi:unnamed protein product [Acanthoscelides obtectus]|uniref:Endonuclease/exonuclease/phosphatase domain-containing protein n=1 Tax=Acanthoscelides obtectus TaxID=200917 RepID=A0A9P0MMB1_ACAOB|nr:unnamed protein product [Acanthoscelides obtectus]CAK1641260.1 hypothetical protein AOBTE_LOCUS12281 [Acanthoscelides obtectus]
MASTNLENNLRIGHINVRSLIPSLNEINSSIYNLKLDILGVTESWLTEQVSEQEVKINNFKFYRVDRGSRGGGIGVYVRSDITVVEIDVTKDQREIFEQQWLILKIGKIKLGLGIIYRPPRFNVMTALRQLEESIANLIPVTDELIIMGDININLLRHTNITNQFNNLLDTFNFKQVVINPARYSRDTASLIDVIIMSDDHLLSGSAHHQDLHQHSDHQLIHCSINIKISAVRPIVIKYRNFIHFDIYSFKQDLINFPWWQVVDCDNVNQKTAILSDMILTLFDSHAPICEKKVTSPPSPWFTDALRAMKNII